MDNKMSTLFNRLTTGKHLLVSTALLLTLGNGGTCYAQNAFDGNKESTTEDGSSSDNSTNPKLIDELNGIIINKNNFKEFISVGNGGSNSTVDGSASHRVFILYNVGAKKFLTSGTFWGRHAALSDKPQLFWFQRRNEQMGYHSQPLRYPTCEEDKIDLEGSSTSYNDYFLSSKDSEGKSGFASMYFGSQEGNGRSQATYKSIRILHQDGSVKKVFLNEGEITSEGSSAQLTENGYQPNGSKFKSAHTLEDLDLSAGETLEFQITLPSSDNRTNQDLLSVGPDIANWFGQETLGNLHIYYLLGNNSNKKKIEVDFTRGRWDTKQTVLVQQDQFRTQHVFELGEEVIIRISSSGISVGNELMLAANTGNFHIACPTKPTKEQEVAGTEPYDTYITYMKEKAGDIIKFKTDANGNYLLDASSNLQEADEEDIKQNHWKEWRANQKAYVYVDEANEGDNASLFISQKIIKEAGSYDNVGKFLAFAHDPNLTIEGATGIYTDREMNSYTSGFGARNYGQWTFVPVEGQTGIYKLKLYMKNETDGTAINNEKTYYLTGTNTFLHGNSTLDNPNAYYYHQMDEKGNWTQLEESTDRSTNEYTSVDLSEQCDDDFSSWKILTQQEYARLENNSQEDLVEPVDVTYLVSDPGFSRKSGGLRSWNLKDGNLGTGTTYSQATLRIGYEGVYKPTTSYEEYQSGKDYNYDSSDSKNYGADNLYNSTHAQYMCATIQNGGYGKFYQQVSVYKKGWYILSCQGMSTVGAKLYIKVANDDETTQYYPLTQISQSFYQNSLVCADASKTYWPLDSKKPMYNASVWMNDPMVEAYQANIDRYKNQVSIYIPKLDDHTADGYSYQYKTIEIGIEVPNSNGNAANAKAALANASTRAASSTTDFTAFDSFQLYYSGDDVESDDQTKLLLNEDFTNMDYLDQTKETYKDTELHLNRTFSAGEWNTLVLPVSLTKEQFDGAFGGDNQNAKLLKVSKIDGKRLVFTPETEEAAGGAYLRANKPYLIWTEKEHGNFGKEYSVLLNKKDQTQTENDIAIQTQNQITVSVPRNHFTIQGVTLPTNNATNDGYDFAGQFKKTLGGESCLYVVGGDNPTGDNGKASGNSDNIAYDQTDGNLNTERYATFYGTLCKTYDMNESGKNAFLPNRPQLSDGKSFYMKPNGGNNFYYRKAGSGYGLKGFRCWFVYEDGTASGAAAAKQFAIDIQGVTDDVTDIDHIMRNDGTEIADQYAHGIYNLNGQKITEGKQLSDLPAGIYIVNGKKYIVNK